MGIEPTTNSLEGCDSTTELLPHRSRLHSNPTSPPASTGSRLYCAPRDSSITFAVWNITNRSSVGDRFLM
jgi:hypothetical protein